RPVEKPESNFWFRCYRTPHHHAIERFETSPNKVRNGEAGLMGPLSADDRAFLDGMGMPWSLIQDGGAWAVVLTGYRLPNALAPQVVDLMVRIPVHYPATGLDMFNCRPPVARVDGRPLANLSCFAFRGEQWQQWSRHRLPHNPWDPSADSMATHFSIIEDALAHDAA
ncbi:MAG: E2/UBC family protein, partial [Acetobacteraceae bacterium]|nr:E2/UBC family protein [Acetobacteraceae bacterium]